jgi:hypothetical protein
MGLRQGRESTRPCRRSSNGVIGTRFAHRKIPCSSALASSVGFAHTASPLINRSRSAKNSPADEYRFAGSFSIAVRQIACTAPGISSRNDRGNGGSTSATALNTLPGVAPSNGRCPVSTSNNITPSENTSAVRCAGCPTLCSGAKYAGVPCKYSAGSPSAGRAIPKSTIFTRRCRSTSTFAGFKSR